jgi:5'-hydroxyaverantin dehydrogenase
MAGLFQTSIVRPSVPIDFSQAYDASSLKGQNVFITGGAMGIGQSLAIGFAEAGAYVTIADLSVKDGIETFASLLRKGLSVQFVKTDVTSWASLVNAFKTALEFGPNKTIDIVIPNAGVGGQLLPTWLENAPLDAAGDPLPVVHKALDINLEAVYNTAHLALYYFKKQPGPNKDLDKQIIFVSSMAGFSSMTNAAEYASSKWGVRGLFRSFRGAHKILGEGLPLVRTNMINPGFIRTQSESLALISAAEAGYANLNQVTQGFHSLVDEGKMQMGKPSDVADVVLRLASDKTIIGRGVSINAGVNFDLGDDTERSGWRRIEHSRKQRRKRRQRMERPSTKHQQPQLKPLRFGP